MPAILRPSLTCLALGFALLAPACAPATAGQEPSSTSPVTREPRPEPEAAMRPLRAAFLVVDGVYNSELMAPYDVLHHTVFHTGTDPGIEPFVVSPDGEPVTSFEGIEIVPHHSFESAPFADILVVPSAEGSMDADLENRAMIDWVRETAASAGWVMSLCDGAFVLAEAGLLDGLSATTFPADYDAFAARYPDVHLRINVSFAHDGKFLTSQGGAKSYDVAMYLVDRLFGREVAQGVGRGLLIPWPPEPHEMPTFVTAAPAESAEPPAGTETSGPSEPQERER